MKIDPASIKIIAELDGGKYQVNDLYFFEEWQIHSFTDLNNVTGKLHFDIVAMPLWYDAEKVKPVDGVRVLVVVMDQFNRREIIEAQWAAGLQGFMVSGPAVIASRVTHWTPKPGLPPLPVAAGL